VCHADKLVEDRPSGVTSIRSRLLAISRHEGRHLRQYRQHRRYELGLPPLPIVAAKLGRESRGGCASIVSIAHRLTSTIGAENQEGWGQPKSQLAPPGGRISSINLSFARLNGLTNLTLCNKNPSCRSSVSRHRRPARCAEAHSSASQNGNR
jgi:hypothetical protein